MIKNFQSKSSVHEELFLQAASRQVREDKDPEEIRFQKEAHECRFHPVIEKGDSPEPSPIPDKEASAIEKSIS